MRAGRGLLRRDRQGQSRPRAEDDQDAGRSVRRGRQIRGPDRGDRVIEPRTSDKGLGVEAVAMTMRFGDFTALDNVELKVKAGTFHALLGENGAGKSTLVKCIMGYYQADDGELLVDDRQQVVNNPR